MGQELRTERSHRTWRERILLWPRAYQTKISDKGREVVGRGPDPEASKEAARKRWVEGQNADAKS